MTKQEKTVNVIGAGLSGLVCAAMLATHGVKVRVLERLSMAGGVTVTFKRNGYKFEGSTHQICGFDIPYYFPTFLREIGIKDLKILNYKSLFNSNLIENGSIKESISLPVGMKSIFHVLKKIYPENIKDIRKFLTINKKIGQDMFRLKHIENARNKLFVLQNAITAWMLTQSKEGSVINKIGQSFYPGIVKNLKKTFSEIYNFLPESLFLHLSNYCFFSGLPPSRVSGLISSAIFYLFGFHKPQFIKGGIGQLIGRLCNVIKSKGGEILLNNEVKKIRMSNGKTIGVESQNGLFYPSDFIVSSISTRKVIFDLIGESYFPSDYTQSLHNLTLATSAFQVYVGTRKNIVNEGFAADNAFFHYSSNCEKNFTSSIKQGVSPQTSFMYTNYSLIDSSYNPEGKTSFVLVELDNYDRWKNLKGRHYIEKKKITENIIIEKFEKATGIHIREKADIIFSATPLTYKYYMNNECGEIYGAAHTVEQSILKRTPHESPIENFMLIGHYTQTGAGIAAVMDGAGLTARSILKKL